VLLDENSKMLSANYRENEFNLYTMLSEKFNRQILIVTHSQELADLATNKIVIGA
jgi:ABC-type lipoprotein export system ATPase subunit